MVASTSCIVVDVSKLELECECVCAMTTFFHLPRDDILFSLIFLHLEAHEVWALRLVCREFCCLCDEYFSTFCTCIAYNELLLEEARTLRNRTRTAKALGASKKLKNISVCLSNQETWSIKLQRASNLLMTTVWRLHEDCHLARLSLVAVDYSLKNSDWRRLGERCRFLRELHIEDMSLFDDKCLQDLTRECTSLVHLALKSLPALRGHYLQELAETSLQLTTLNVRNNYVYST